jgi:tetrahydromethanopterin S-methyltransferase subunit G
MQCYDSCDLLVWDDELYEVEAANPRGQRQASMQLGEEFGKGFCQEFGKAFGQEFGKAFGQEFGTVFGKEFGNGFGNEFGTQIGNEIGKKLGHFVWVAIFMCGIMIAMLFKTM